jgi:hypothetical protein
VASDEELWPRDGHDQLNAIKLLGVLYETLEAMVGYRAAILEQIERLSNK